MAEAHITAEVLTWARNRAGFDIETLSVKANVKPDDLQSWEISEANPSFPQALRLAEQLRVPFGYLFLSDPPEDEPHIPDLRTIADEQRNTFSIDFVDVLSDCLLKQSWYRNHLLDEGVPALPFIGKYSLSDPPETVAQDIRDIVGLDYEFRAECSSWTDFLDQFVENVEARRILVLKNGVVGNSTRRKLAVGEFRGLVLTDPTAPLIFLNNNDAKAAQIFTLAHELAHLWIGETGVSNINPGRRSDLSEPAVERFCNSVAAETLVPAAEFHTYWNNAAPLADNVDNLARHFRVSSLVVLIRAKEFQQITPNEFYEQYAAQLAQQRPPGGSGSGGNFYNTLPVRNSKTFTRAIVSAAFDGRAMYREAAQLLSVKVPTLDGIADHLGIR